MKINPEDVRTLLDDVDFATEVLMHFDSVADALSGLDDGEPVIDADVKYTRVVMIAALLVARTSPEERRLVFDAVITQEEK